MTRTNLITHNAKALVGGLALSIGLAAAPAHAGVMTTAVQPYVASLAVDAACFTQTKRTGFAQPVRPTNVRSAKSQAILGNEMSALEMMKAQQAGAGATQVAETVQTFPIETLAPASAGRGQLAEMCSAEIAPFSGSPQSSGIIQIPGKAETAMPVGTREPILETLGNDDFLASKRIRIGKTSFDRDWNRVRKETLSGVFQANFRKRPGASLQTIDEINRWVNRKIDYVEDRDLFGKADHWAGARRTLKLGKGDCEDYALTKMQLLAAAGIRRQDMYLSIVKDTVRRQDHAFLIVKHQGQYLILDNATDTILDGSQSHDYKPVLSFNSKSAWLHGY